MVKGLCTGIFFLVGITSLLHCEGSQGLTPRIFARAAVLINADTGQLLFEKNGDEPLYPASTTKILTAFYALEKKGYDLDALVPVSTNAVRVVSPKERRSKHPSYRLEYGGTSMGLFPGEILSFRALLYGLLLKSGNDAANVIAEYVSGNIEAFVKELNAFIQKKGCMHTTLRNPHGLPDPQHKISARELGLLTVEAMHNPFFREVVKTVRSVRPKTDQSPEYYFTSKNALIKPSSKFYYPKATGVKIGYTEAAGQTIVASAEEGDRKLVAVLFGASSNEARYQEVRALFDVAFAEKKRERKLHSQEFDWFRTKVPEGKSFLEAKLHQDLIVSYYPSEEKELHTEVAWNLPKLPIASGQEVGVIRVYDSASQLVVSAPLFAAHDVEAVLSKRLREGIQKRGILVLVGFGFALLLVASKVRKKRKELP